MSLPIKVDRKERDISSKVFFGVNLMSCSLSCTSPQLAHCLHAPFSTILVLLHFLQASMLFPLRFSNDFNGYQILKIIFYRRRVKSKMALHEALYLLRWASCTFVSIAIEVLIQTCDHNLFLCG